MGGGVGKVDGRGCGGWIGDEGVWRAGGTDAGRGGEGHPLSHHLTLSLVRVTYKMYSGRRGGRVQE